MHNTIVNKLSFIGSNGRVHMEQKADWKALSKADWEADPFPDWVPDLNYECSHGPAASRFGRLDHEQNQRTTCRRCGGVVD